MDKKRWLLISFGALGFSPLVNWSLGRAGCPGERRKMASFYISKCKVVTKDIGTVKDKKKRGWFKYEYIPREVYYVFCQPPEDVISDTVFKIEVNEEDYKKIAIDGSVSVHINAKYEFACFHDLSDGKKATEIITCKQKYY